MHADLETLLVEDNPDGVELTLHALQNENIRNRVRVVRDGEEALDYIFCPGTHAHRQAELVPSLLLLHLKLPKVDGIEVLRAIRVHPKTRAIPVMILTASREERDLMNGCEEGPNSLHSKARGLRPIPPDGAPTAFVLARDERIAAAANHVRRKFIGA